MSKPFLKRVYRIPISDPFMVSLNSGITDPVLGLGIWGIYPVALMTPSHYFLTSWLSPYDNAIGHHHQGALFLVLPLLKSRVSFWTPSFHFQSQKLLCQITEKWLLNSGEKFSSYANGCHHPYNKCH